MKELVFSDSRNLTIQSIAIVEEGKLHVRTILTNSEQLKALFMDTFATQKMTVYENHVEKETYENYDKLSYIKEEAGGIWEVEMLQREKDTSTLVKELTNELVEAKKELNGVKGKLEDAVKETSRLTEENNMITQCLLEMSEMVYQ